MSIYQFSCIWIVNIYIYISLTTHDVSVFGFSDARWPSSVLSWPWAVPRRWAKGAVDEWRQMKKDDQINQDDHVMSGDFMWFHVQSCLSLSDPSWPSLPDLYAGSIRALPESGPLWSGYFTYFRLDQARFLQFDPHVFGEVQGKRTATISLSNR